MFRYFKKNTKEAVEANKARQASGVWGEKVAAEFLERRGFVILGRRVRILRDEIDIVALRSAGSAKQVVFVEIKTRKSQFFGGGLAAVDRRKRHVLCRAAARYMRKSPKLPFRFDVVEVIGAPESDAPPQIRHVENAFPMELRYSFG